MNIPLYKPYLPIEIRDFSVDAMDCGWLGYGKKAQELESIFTQHLEDGLQQLRVVPLRYIRQHDV